jgi:hypothetical protein
MFTRDSFVWWFGMAGSLIGELAMLKEETLVSHYGVPAEALPYLHLASLVVGVVSAWMKTSPRPHSEEGDMKVTPSGR